MTLAGRMKAHRRIAGRVGSDPRVGLHAKHTVGTIAFLLYVAATFLAMIQPFNAVFGVAVGRVVTVAFSMFQLVSAGGIYPVETTARPAFPDHPSIRTDDLRRQRFARLHPPIDG
jgi:hypothetical protein